MWSGCCSTTRFQFDFGPADCWTLFHSYCFDFSVWEMYGALLYGGRLVIIPKDTVAQYPDQFPGSSGPGAGHGPQPDAGRLLQSGRSAVRRLPEAALQLRMVIFGGEALKPIHAEAIPRQISADPADQHVRHHRNDGPCHLSGTAADDDINSSICNIGRPIPTTKVYILDQQAESAADRRTRRALRQRRAASAAAI